ncbi:putative salivary gland-expressed bHLH [Danaus plexippus plexippus]|uniref:Salivary gland-expressed bHLH n=1 Tax=Danaus plexippus plexippus TaxID=278856 RepID=A0A212EN01_DANPL|nr:helix-loop-helix protein 1 [Danaus plexippus plexippus]OWR42856.1 putative salivary gland-expressed bHLH [Danaus plexippus plexippus]
MKSWLETASSMEDGSMSCMLAESREALLPITGSENLAPRKRTLEPCALSDEAYLSSGTGSPCAGLTREERRRRRRATLKYRTAHATRERIRVEAFNAAFASLRRLLPTLPPDKKLSKIEILRLAICYIAYLNHVLDA